MDSPIIQKNWKSSPEQCAVFLGLRTLHPPRELLKEKG
jgi:hypothetical protein